MSNNLNELSGINKYNKHVFICINSRIDPNESSCGNKGLILRQEMVKILATYDYGNVRIRINQSGCLDECQFGPVVVIYPQGFWYYNVNLSDINEIIQHSIINDSYINRLSNK